MVTSETPALPPSARRFSVSRLLNLNNDMRVQNPGLTKTTGANPRWLIRPYVTRLQPDGSTSRVKERIYLGSCAAMTKRQAQAAANAAMTTLNNEKAVVTAQIIFRDFLAEYEKDYVLRPENLSVATQARYISQIRNHIEPAFANRVLGEVNTKLIEVWMATKINSGMAWASRVSLRNLLSGMFTHAIRWGYCEKNPVIGVSVGKRMAVREKRKLSDEDTVRLLNALPVDVRLICELALFCTLRISEVMGLQWKDIDFERGVVKIRRRYYRGNLASPKTQKAIRDVPLGILTSSLQFRCPTLPEHDDDFVFSIKTRRGSCRDDRDINRHFLRKAAKKLGLYSVGFGFHAFRREAITSISRSVGVAQAMKAAGHTKADMSQEYILSDLGELDRAIVDHQHRILGAGKTVESVTPVVANGPKWAKTIQCLLPEVPEDVRKLLEGLIENGGLEKTRTSDLFRVKEAL